jgi:ribosomal protein L4
MATPTFTGAGAKATTAAKLSKEVFSVEVNNHQLLKQAYEAYLANGRDNLAVVKTRGLVSGGGRKPCALSPEASRSILKRSITHFEG